MRMGWQALVGLTLGLVAGCNEAPPADDLNADSGEKVTPLAEPVVMTYPQLLSELDTEYQPLRLVQLAGDLDHPWSLALLPDNSFLVTERSGQLLHIAKGETREVAGTPEVTAINQGGLFDVALHPGFDRNQQVYLTWSQGDEDGTALALGRGRLVEGQLEDFERIWLQNRQSSPGRHYGGRMAWLDDGTLLLTVGDRGTEPSRAQDLEDHAGSILRLTADGEPAPDNPRANEEKGAPALYSWGHRNIQGMVVRSDGEVWVAEHGPRGGDELNRIRPGANYGWPEVGKGRDYATEAQFGEARSREGMEEPVYEFLPTLAPSGLIEVTSERYPHWRGNLLAGGLRAQRLARLVLEDGVVVHEEALLQGQVGRIREIHQGHDGYLYVLNDELEGGVFRLEPVSE